MSLFSLLVDSWVLRTRPETLADGEAFELLV